MVTAASGTGAATWEQVAYVVSRYRFAQPATAVAIVMAESGGDPSARRPASQNPGGGDDRGWWQINSKAHPDVPDSTAYDPFRATEWASTASQGGTEWGIWNYGPRAYSGRSRTDLDLVRAAQAVRNPQPYSAPNVGTATPAGGPLGGVALPIPDPERDIGPVLSTVMLAWCLDHAGMTDDGKIAEAVAYACQASLEPTLRPGPKDLPSPGEWLSMYAGTVTKADGKQAAVTGPSGNGCFGMSVAQAAKGGLTAAGAHTPMGNARAYVKLTQGGQDTSALASWKNGGKWGDSQAKGKWAVHYLRTDLDPQGKSAFDPNLYASASGQANPELNVPNPLSGLSGLVKLAGRILSVLTSLDFWKRAGWVLLGVGLIVAGLMLGSK